MKTINELKSKFTFHKDFIDVDKRFISKYHLTNYDLRELISILYGEQRTTINSNIIKVFKEYNVIYIPEGIGWRLENGR